MGALVQIFFSRDGVVLVYSDFVRLYVYWSNPHDKDVSLMWNLHLSFQDQKQLHAFETENMKSFKGFLASSEEPVTVNAPISSSN